MRWKRALLTLVALLTLLCCRQALAQERIRLGVLAYLGAEHSFEGWAPTVRALDAALPRARVEVRPYDHGGLDRALATGELDFVLTNPGHYIQLEVAHGVSRIATRQSNMPVASTIIVRSERTDIRELNDLKGKRVAIVGSAAFGGYQVAWRELAAAGINPARDLTLVTEGLPMTGVIQAVLSHKVDAGIVRGCLVEQREREGALAKGAVRVLSPMPAPSIPCTVSSRVYPDWPFAKSRATSDDLARKVASALLAFEPEPNGAGWTVPVDYQPVHELFRELMIGPYEQQRHVSLAQLLRRHWHWVALAALLLLVWLLHVLRVEGLVRLRTRELAVANADLTREIEARKAAEERDALHRRELDHVGRLSIVGEMASGLAHELNQPLAAIKNYADGCQFRLQSGEADDAALIDATRRIRQQAERAGQIIQRMRAFARKREPVRAPLAMEDVARETIELFEGPARRAGVTVELATSAPQPMVLADRIQLQQVLLNLMQNSLDALRSSDMRRKLVKIELEINEGGTVASVIDNGPGISAAEKARLFEPFFTTKPEGLGLGLALCRSIVAEHNGRLSAHDNPGGGAIMRLWLPAVQNEGAQCGGART